MQTRSRHHPPITAPAHRVWALLAAIAAVGAGGVCGPVRAEAEVDALGRLFFTPERRAELDRQRYLNVKQARVMEGDNLTVNGVIRRSSGHSTVWINGVAHQDNRPTSEVTPLIDGRNANRVVLKAGDDVSAPLKVGESINRATGERQDGLAGGRIAIGRGAARAPRRP